MTDDEFRSRAKREYEEDGRVEIDPNAKVSRSEDGAYVQAWVWVEDTKETA